MAFSLYDATVPAYLQTLRATHGWLGRTADLANNGELEEIGLIEGKLAPDMFAFNRQVRAVAMHSQGALEGAARGVFSPDLSPAPTTLAGLQDRLAEAIAYCEALDRGALEALAEQPMRFEFGETRLPFVTREFLTSFSLPNFFFHASTAYAIARNQGMALGKRDFLGQLRVAAD